MLRLRVVVGIVPAALTSAVFADVPTRAVRLQTGLARPVFATAPVSDPSRLFIAEQHTGNIRILNLTSNTLEATPFLTITDLAKNDEQGLLGLAFHPNFAVNGQFYVNITISPGGPTVIRRYTVDPQNPNRADTSSAQTVLTFEQPEVNHNGGWIGFSPKDGYLYIASGDGGGANDMHGTIGNGQNINTLLGKMLRIDVDGDDFAEDPTRNYRIPRGGAGAPPKNPFAQGVNEETNPVGADEIWHYGLRNPFRSAFDRKTGDLYIGDVGQADREEINFAAANSTGGLNFGWRAREGTIDNAWVDDPAPPDYVDPILEYAHDEGFSVTGGTVYRGSENPALEGRYFYADYLTSRIWTTRYSGSGSATARLVHEPGGAVTIESVNGGELSAITSFGEDALGRIYVTKLSNTTLPAGAADGELYRLVPEIPGDANLDRVVDHLDFEILHANFEMAGAKWADGDFTDDGVVNFADFQVVERWFGTSIPVNGVLGATSVPEPAGLMLAIPLLVRRRRGR